MSAALLVSAIVGERARIAALLRSRADRYVALAVAGQDGEVEIYDVLADLADEIEGITPTPPPPQPNPELDL